MSQHLVGTAVQAARCSTCDGTVLMATVGGLTTVVDTKPLSLLEEAAAILIGRATFDLLSTGNQMHLDWRDITRIRAGRNYPVLAAHGCPRGTQHPIPLAKAVEEVPDDPPF